MKQIFICGIYILSTTIAFASPYADSLLTELDDAIKHAGVYDNNKLKEIAALKSLSQKTPKTDAGRQYDIHLTLYEHYKYYNYDSALLYAKKLQQFAENKNNPSLLIDSRLKVIFIMLTAGMFKETFDSLNIIPVKDGSDSVKAEFYTLSARAYYNLADFNNDTEYATYYNNKANLYVDSALDLYSPDSFDCFYFAALQFLKKGYPDSALYNLNKIIVRKNLTYHEIALATSTIGGIYMSQGQEEKAKTYLIKASIADIKSSTKETLALLVLAGIVYKEGNIEDAVQYIEKANADASFYNARLRKVQVGAILPLIEGEMINTIRDQKEKVVFFLVLLSIFALLSLGFAILIRSQVKKLKVARASLFKANIQQQQINHELTEANELKEKYNYQLKEINTQLIEANTIKENFNVQLQDINRQLLEANKIKEEYIGYYFTIDTAFLSKIEKLINSLNKKLIERKWDDINFILKSVEFKKEKDELLKNFDKIFLRLFPNFVTQFNTLFREEDKIILKEDQLLNTELRIFALIRLGITENEKIAEILGYSINTIYSKKTKIRSKTIINKDELERKITEITTISQ